MWKRLSLYRSNNIKCVLNVFSLPWSSPLFHFLTSFFWSVKQMNIETGGARLVCELEIESG